MATHLSFDDEHGRRRRLPLESEVTIGRGDGCTVRLPARNVSRRHARLLCAGGTLFVEDLGSRNGTFLNGERLRGRQRLRAGDRVRVGDETLILQEPSSEETLDLAPAQPSPPPLPARRTPLPSAPEAEERTLAMAAAAPQPRSWRAAVAAALRAIAGRRG